MELKKEEFLEFSTDVFQSFLSDHKINSFPGNLPISLQKSHLLQLPFGFVISNKTDGERSFIFICENHIFSINRNLDIHLLGLIKNINKNDLYLFDAEIVYNLDLILIFDVLVFKSKNVLRSDITQRNELARYFLFTYGEFQKEDPFWSDIRFPSNYPSNILKVNNFTIETKPLFKYHHLINIWKNQHRLPYDCDGIIFSREWAAYKPFTQDPMSLIKWKTTTTLDFLVLSNNIDCKLVEIPENFSKFQFKNGNFILATGKNEFFSLLDLNSPNDFDGHIVECKWENETWVLIKKRIDKTSPNKLTTVLKSLINIKEPISIHDFIL